MIQEDVIPQFKKLFSTRAIIAVSAACLFAIALSSCGIALNEGNGNPNGELKLNDGGASCIEHSLPKIQRYFEGTATAEETNESWSCLNVALQMFNDNVRGKDPNSYTPDELRSFLESYFLGNIKLTPRLMSEAFQLKKIFLGGDGTKLTREELKRLMEDISLLQGETVRLLPHLKVVLQKAPMGEGGATNEQVQAAKVALNEMTDVLARIFQHAEIEYAEQHIDALLDEVQGLFNQTGSKWQGPTVARKYLPTFFVFKSFLLDGFDNAVYPKEWGNILKLSSRLYGSYLQIKYLVQPSVDTLHGDGLRYFNQLLNEAFALLQSAIDNKQSKSIPFETLDKVVDQLYFMGIVRSDFVTENTLQNVVRTVVGKIYHPAEDGVRPIASGLDTSALTLMRKDFYGFAEMQSVYDTILSQVNNEGKTLTYRELIDRWPLQGSRADHLSQIHQLLKLKTPLMWDDQFFIVYDDSGFAEKMTSRKFTELNWRRMLIYILARGYAQNGNTVEQTGLRPQEDFQSLYWDFRLIAHELSFLDKNQCDIWKSTAGESRIFFLSSDGKPNISLTKGYDFLGLGLNSGKFNLPIYQEMRKLCKHTDDVDGFGDPLIDYSCYRKMFDENFARYFAKLPHWVEAVSKLDSKASESFKKNLELVTLKNAANPEKGISSGDLAKMASVFQYAESVFWKFDKNRDGILDYSETGDDAFALFHDYLAEAAASSGITSESDLKALFTYLLRYKRVPSTLVQKAEFLWWKMNKSGWKYTVSRPDILEIIVAMKKQSAQNPSPPLQCDSSSPTGITLGVDKGVAQPSTDSQGVDTLDNGDGGLNERDLNDNLDKQEHQDFPEMFTMWRVTPHNPLICANF